MTQPYIPSDLPIENLDWSKFVHLIGKANAEVARFDALMQTLHNPIILLRTMTTQEAVLSSRIEGTHATLDDVLRFEAAPDEESPKFPDIQEVINYRKALHYGEEHLDKISLSLRLIREMHSILMNGVRGKDRDPGNYRRVQNWIGPSGSVMESATYVPPSPEKIADHLGNLEKYIHIDDKDALVQAAIVHAQFELIHPFLDGNGRLGRILLAIFLYFKKALTYPMFFQSAYFEFHREEYYRKLQGISGNNDWESWIEYFLTGVAEQSKINTEKVRSIRSLYEEKKERIAEVTKSQYAIRVLDFLFAKPVFRSSDFAAESRIPKATANRILQQLEEAKVIFLVSKGKGTAPSMYGFTRLVKLLKP